MIQLMSKIRSHILLSLRYLFIIGFWVADISEKKRLGIEGNGNPWEYEFCVIDDITACVSGNLY